MEPVKSYRDASRRQQIERRDVQIVDSSEVGIDIAMVRASAERLRRQDEYMADEVKSKRMDKPKSLSKVVFMKEDIAKSQIRTDDSAGYRRHDTV